jgi:cbb3-type cytochrome oxidase subunit 3
MRQLLGPLPNVGASVFFTVLFTALFVGLCWYVYRGNRRSLYSQLEKMPLTEE